MPINFSVCRPLLPAACRKRTLYQGQALRAANAGLDMRVRASGAKYMRAMGGDGSAGGCRTWTLYLKCERQKGKIQKAFLPDATRRFYFRQLQIFILRIGNFKNTDRIISFCQPAIFWMHTE